METFIRTSPRVSNGPNILELGTERDVPESKPMGFVVVLRVFELWRMEKPLAAPWFWTY